jgi:hypothetical protein
MQYINEHAPVNTRLFVLRNPPLAKLYAANNISVEQFQRSPDNTVAGSLLLLTTRANADLDYHSNAPVFYQTGREGAIFCIVRQIR